MDEPLTYKKINLSGWATKDFTLRELRKYLFNKHPNVLEISKILVDSRVSIKNICKLIKEYKRHNSLIISYAGTTDFVKCSGFSFSEYIKYLSIQASQANFLGADFFRIMAGGEPNSEIEVLERLSSFEKTIAPIKILIEIHGGWESSIKNINKIINRTNYNFVIDFENLLESDLSFQRLNGLIPKERIEYYHTRNIDSIYIEHKKSLLEEEQWICRFSEQNVLWEPKLIKKKEILEIFENIVIKR